MVTFSNKLSEILHIKGVSKRELSKKTGITEQSICRYANGTRVPKGPEIVLIANALNVDANELLGTNKEDVSVSEVLTELNILSNDITLSVSECIEYHRAKIIVERIYKELTNKTRN